MGCGASRSVDVQVDLSPEEKRRFVSELRSEIRDQVIAEQQQQVVNRIVQREQETQTDEFVTETEEIQSPTNIVIEDGDSDYQSDVTDDEDIQNADNEDIDFEYLARDMLQAYEKVDSDVDEESDDEMTSIYLEEECVEEVDDFINDEISGSEQPPGSSIEGSEVQPEPPQPPEPKFQPNFADFPSHKTLQLENERYWRWRERHNVPMSDTSVPIPARESKKSIFDQSKFEQLDKFAIEAPRELLNKTVKEVVEFLTQNYQTDLERTRVIFRWLVAQDLQKLPSKKKSKDTIQERLQGIHNDRESYSNVFSEMLSFAGLECRQLRGAAKAAKYELGDKIDIDVNRGSWEAVKICNEWRLVDINFAARQQTGGSHGEWELIDDNGKGYTPVNDAPVGLSYEIDDFYFLTDPEEFIYNHLPTDPEWQLLARSVSKDEFKDMAYLRSSFFELDLDVRAARRCVLHAISGESVIKLGLPKTGQRKFMYKLWKSSKDGVKADTIKDIKLTQFVFMEQRGGILICKINFPLIGKYKFQLFSNNSSSGENSYTWVADYLIYCTKEKSDYQAMPTNSRHEWGPGQDLGKLGVTPITHVGGVIETEDGHALIKFKTQKPIELMAKLRVSNGNEQEQWVLHREENGEAVVHLRIQEKGTYALDLYAKPEGQEGSVPHVCTYLVRAADGVYDKLKFPSTVNQQAGCTKDGAKFSLIPISHKESYFTSAEGHEDIVFEYTPPLYFSTQLHLQSTDSCDEIENHVFIQQDSNRVTFKARFPKTGIYLLKLFTKRNEADATYPNFYNYVIYVPKAMEGCVPFPMTYNLWGQGCSVEGLEDGVVTGGDTIKVKATIPGAHKVAVIGSKWTYLKQNTEGEWDGDVEVDNDASKMKLSACFEENGSSYSTLTEYQVKTKDELEMLEEEKNRIAEMEAAKKKEEEDIKRRKQEEFERIQKELQDAIESRDLQKLQSAVKLVEENAYKNRMRQDYNTAKNLITSMERMARLSGRILKMNRPTMAEIKNYAKPPPVVHRVMMATMLMLKENESFTKDWKNCQSLSNTSMLKKKVKSFDVHSLHPEIAARAKQILAKFRLDDVALSSAGAACFYVWAAGMADELNILQRNCVKKARPASVKRQMEIFENNV